MKKQLLWKYASGVIFSAALCMSLLMKMTVSAEEKDGMVRSSYTNEWISKEQAALRPIAVMMPTDKIAQPSFGIGEAKILYEIMEEGEISRQMAIIDNWTGLEKIGNIRSCRAYYISEAMQWDPILVHFGGVWYMKDQITNPVVQNLSGANQYGIGGGIVGEEAFFRTKDRRAPHNAYTSANGIISAGNRLGYSFFIRPEFYHEKQFLFAKGVNDLKQYKNKAEIANEIDLSTIFTYTRSKFIYQEKDGLYYKTIHNKPQIDGNTGEQLAFANVIIQSTKWCQLDENGYLYFQTLDQMEEGYYFTKGRVIPIRWTKNSDLEPTVYFDESGNEIELNEGKTYIGIAQKGRLPIYK